MTVPKSAVKMTVAKAQAAGSRTRDSWSNKMNERMSVQSATAIGQTSTQAEY